MLSSEAIAILDRQIAQHGDPVTLKRASTTHDLRGLVRGKTASEIEGTLSQMAWMITLSPTGIGAFGIPKATDKVTVNGKTCQIKQSDPVHMNGVLVRINILATG